MSNSKIDFRFKIIILGESNVGKTCLLRKYKNDEFQDSLMSTIGIDTVSKRIYCDKKNVMLNIWDTAGQERFFSITKSYYRNADGILLIFDVSDERSFSCIDRWHKNIREECEETPLFLVGNKRDKIGDQVYEDIKHRFLNKAEEINTQFYSTSAKTGYNVSNIFEDMASMLIRVNGQKKENKKPSEVREVKKVAKKKRRFCC